MPAPPTMYKNDRAGSNSWLVYMNGLQVPANAVSVTHGVWQIPQAQISMVPDPRLARLGAEDRIMVQVFYCDQWYQTPPAFCLAFDGEIVAWGYAMAGAQRAISFTCIDYMQILTQLFFFFMSSFDDIAVGVSGAEIGVQGSTIQMAGFGALYPYSLFSQGLADPGDTVNNNAVISRPIDFAYNIVRALIKAQHPNRTIPSANFFAPWCKRTNFHRRWVALPYLDADPGGNPNVGVFPILRAVQAEQAIAAVVRMASTMGTSGSMWDMLRDVLMTMMMEVSMIPTPSIVNSDFTSLLPKGPPVQGAPQFLASYFVKPQFFFGLPPACNVFFPSQVETYSYQENFITQPTRMYFNEEAILSALNANGSVDAGLGALMQDALTTAYPEEVDLAARAAIATRGLNGKNLLVYPEEFFKGPVIDRRSMPRWFTYLLEASRTTADPQGGGSSQETRDAQDADQNNIGAVTVQAIPSGELNGATHAVYDTSTFFHRYVRQITAENRARPAGQRLSLEEIKEAARQRGADEAASIFGVRLPPRRGFPSPAVRDQISAYRRNGDSDVGGAVPPELFPLVPASAGNVARAGGAGGFFAGRSGGSRIHGGIDIGCARGIRIVATTAGRIGTIRRNTSPTDVGGNWVSVVDANRGVHRYMHLDSIDPGISVGTVVHAGMTLGTAGNTGGGGAEGGGVHLHYDVTSSKNYRLNYEDRIRALQSGRAYTTPTAVQQPVAAPPAANAAPTPAPAPATQPVTTTTPARDLDTVSPANPQNAEISSGDTTRNIFKTYAAYEYYKERYSRRQGSVTLAYNPYVVAGFPCTVFDHRATAMDTIGYVMSVRQTMTAAAWSTDVAFSHGRTLQEMFALMQRTYASEDARLGVERAQISEAVLSRNATALAGFATPLGALATAPAEPLVEISNVIQNFARADEFYKALFHQGRAVGADRLTAAQLLQNNELAGDLYVPYVRADELAASQARGESTDELVAQARQAGVDATTQQVANATSSAQRPSQKAVFYYPDIIDFMTDDGTRSGIQIQGTDGLSVARMLRAISDIRTGSISDADWDFFIEVTQQVGVRRPTADSPELDESSAEILNGLEIGYRTRTAESNVRGDLSIVPRRGAAALFESYQAAMGYNGRPICTLEQYIDFLGPDGLREGPVDPSGAAARREKQLHPAKFYARIRRLRNGPPGVRPISNTTGTDVATDSATGATTPMPSAAETGARARSSFAEYLSSLSPDLEAASSAIFVDLVTSGALDVITATTLPELQAQLAEAQTNGQIQPANLARLNAAIARAEQAAGGRLPPREMNAVAPTNTPTVAGATPPASTNVFPVDGIPIDFPETRANWDNILEAYRRDVLTRLAPYA